VATSGGVSIVDPASWTGHATDLAYALRLAVRSGRTAIQPPIDSETHGVAAVEDPSYWARHPAELEEALGLARPTPPNANAAAEVGVAAGGDRLTMTVEEAAKALGISRAFAYEAVRRHEIPAIHIGRRVLVPRAALKRMLEVEQSPLPDN